MERLLAERSATLVVTGHSLGGALAQLCAYDLLHACPAARRCGVLLLPVASPPVFSPGFHARLLELVAKRSLRALHVTATGDFARRLQGSPFRALGMRADLEHGVTRRLVLSPRCKTRPLYFVADGQDDGCADLEQHALDRFAHNCYAKDLCAMPTETRPDTVPADAEWPVPPSV